MYKSIKVRLYPNYIQSQLMNQHFGAVRFLYNKGLDYKKRMYEENGIKLSRYDLIYGIPQLRKEYEWLKECKSECLRTAYDNLDSAFNNFYRGEGYPKFKNKKSNQSFVQKQNINIIGDKIKFMKNLINFKCSDRDQLFLQDCKAKFITYSKDNLNHYYASITYEQETIKKAPLEDSHVGVDVGISHFIVTSDGEFVDNPKFYRKAERNLKKLQKKHSKCQKGSKNRERARIRYAKAAKKVANKRDYFLHSVANKLINENQVITFETLNIAGMIKNHKLAKSIQDAAWAKLIQITAYKAEWYGREVNKIGRFVPSSKTCSCCGEVNKELTLKDRIFECPKCGHVEDRDLNASKNIKNFSIDKSNRDELTRINASGETVSRHLLKEEDTLVA